MNCHQIEELLPAYLDGDLDTDETSAVRAHLDACGGCREAMADFQALEETLLARRDIVPSPAQFVRAVFGVSQESRAHVWINRLVSWPGLTAAGCATLAMFTFIYLDTITAFFTRVSTAIKLPQQTSNPFQSLTDVLMQFTGGDLTMLSAVYAGVTIIILLSTSLVTMRFLRN